MRIKTPLSKEQSKIGDLIPPGIYPFEVLDAEDAISKLKFGADGAPLPQHEMIKLKLKLYMPDGRERIIYDYLMEVMEFKMAHFFDAVGLWDKYESGEVSADDCYGRSGELKIYTQIDKSGANPPRSSVADYLLTEAQEAAKQERKVAAAKQETKSDFIDDALPF